jgi:hypothetical protein
MCHAYKLPYPSFDICHVDVRTCHATLVAQTSDLERSLQMLLTQLSDQLLQI